MKYQLNFFEEDLYNEVFKNFKNCFEILRDNYGLSETLKIHVINTHFKYYFNQTGTNFCKTNGEMVKSCHSTLRIHEEKHNFHIKRKIGTPKHWEISGRSFTFYNSKRAILTPTLKKMRSPKFSPSSSPLY